MDLNHRIAKNTSARKNTIPPGMHSSIEMAAVKASHQTYIDCTIKGYEDKIGQMETDHRAALEVLQAEPQAILEALHAEHQADFVLKEAEHRAAIESAKVEHQNAIRVLQLQHQDAIAVLQTEHNFAMESKKTEYQNSEDVMKSEMQAMTVQHEKKIKTLKAKHKAEMREAKQNPHPVSAEQIQTLEEALEHQIGAKTEGEKTLLTMRAQLETTSARHSKRVAALEEQLRAASDSFTEFHVTGKNRKTRTYIRRSTVVFKEVPTELSKNVGSVIGDVKFKRRGRCIHGCNFSALERLGILSGDTIEIS